MKKVVYLTAAIAVLGLVWTTGTAAKKHPRKAVKTAQTGQTQNTIKFEELSHNFGNVIEGEIARYEFKFTNTGTEPLVLTNVQASCGCTTPKWPRDPIAAGQSSVITAEYNSNGRPGSFTKNIFVKSNGGDVTLTISGMVIKEQEKPKSPIIIKG